MEFPFEVSLNVSENKQEIVNKLLCMACLCVGRNLRTVTDNKLKQYYTNTLKEIPLYNMSTICLNICWECEATLHKAVSFREQIMDSYRILQAYTNEALHECLLTDITRSPRLTVHVNDTVDIEPGKEIASDKDESDHDKPQDLVPVEVYVKNEVKNNFVDYGDDDTNPDETMSDCQENTMELDTKRHELTRANGKRKNSKIKEQNPKVGDHNTEHGDSVTELGDRAKHGDDVTNDDENFGDDERPLSYQNILDEIKNNLASDIEMSSEAEDTALSQNMAEDDISKYLVFNGSTERRKSKTKRLLKNKEKRVKKIVKSLQNKKHTNTKNKAREKILTIELSYEEMMSERDKDLTKDSFVKAEYKCEMCIIGFNYSKSYKTHLQTKHSANLGNYICPICKTVVASVESFTAHYKRHMRRYECSICKKRTMDMKVMQQHYYSTHEISLRQYKCNLCGKISNSIDTHRYHKDTHKARVQCTECDKTFIHRAGLMNHRLAVHELRNVHPCTVCDKVFKWKTSLKRHLEKHAKNKPGEAFCATCNVSFASFSSYQRHMKNSLKHVTQDQLRYICDHCNRRFADKTKLRDHIEAKHLHRTFQCHICLKPSKNRVALDQHVRNVHRGRPNNKICHHCGKGFPTNVQLESHIRTHTGERPFICEYCPTTFSQQSNLYKHNRQVHLNIKSKRYSICKKRKDDKQPTVATTLVPSDHAAPAEQYIRAPMLQYTPDRGFVM